MCADAQVCQHGHASRETFLHDFDVLYNYICLLYVMYCNVSCCNYTWCPSIKLRTALGKFGEFWAHIARFWLAWVGRNHFVNTKFSKLSKEISDTTQYI